VREGRAGQFPRTRDATESEGFLVISVSYRAFGFRRGLGVVSGILGTAAGILGYRVHVIVTQSDDNNIEWASRRVVLNASSKQ